MVKSCIVIEAQVAAKPEDIDCQGIGTFIIVLKNQKSHQDNT